MSNSHYKIAYPALLVLLVISAGCSLSIGAYQVPLTEVWDTLMHSLVPGDANTVSLQNKIVILDIRLPRLFLAILVGAALAVSGSALQGLFRNPLADPGLIGVSSGAALGAVSAIVLGSTLMHAWSFALGFWSVPLAAFIGGMVATIVIYKVATRSGYTSVATLLLSGIAVNAIAGAGIGVLTYVADDAQLRSLTFWSMGSLSQASWNEILTIAPFIAVPLVLLPLSGRALNAFLMGEHVAHHLGFSIKWIKRGVILASTLAVGAAVAVTGTIGFVGLVVPHLLRLSAGPDHRHLMPASALAGALLMVIADLTARTVASPAELPIGLLMSLIGGPFFLALLLKSKSLRGM
jgi:heme transport system permease protein